ncbi:hypothetical protein A3B63_03745 [Candidatus Saccharibacteria bacterium RIFCSPLOWO2_01_FULL_49_22]|nr:MAG: hypothetical protein A3B63_03745 [Candidatus Saccharibacteria bacterium RIFCSPLOWO2_01_FULL_49_22]
MTRSYTHKVLKVYVAGKMSKHSHFDSHHWRDDFLGEIARLTGLKFISFDPTRAIKDYTDPELVFGSDVHMISRVDVLIAYLSDDFSVGGSQEILIAKYLKKPVIGLTPHGGVFNSRTKEITGKVIKNYRHPFVYSTCDIVCGDIKEIAKALENLDKINPKTIKLIDQAKHKFSEKHLKMKLYEEHLIG